MALILRDIHIRHFCRTAALSTHTTPHISNLYIISTQILRYVSLILLCYKYNDYGKYMEISFQSFFRTETFDRCYMSYFGAISYIYHIYYQAEINQNKACMLIFPTKIPPFFHIKNLYSDISCLTESSLIFC